MLLRSISVRFFVMAGLVPAIHVFHAFSFLKTWMPGTRPGMTGQRRYGIRPHPAAPPA